MSVVLVLALLVLSVGARAETPQAILNHYQILRTGS
jgi:hypothetical protein